MSAAMAGIVVMALAALLLWPPLNKTVIPVAI